MRRDLRKSKGRDGGHEATARGCQVRYILILYGTYVSRQGGQRDRSGILTAYISNARSTTGKYPQYHARLSYGENGKFMVCLPGLICC